MNESMLNGTSALQIIQCIQLYESLTRVNELMEDTTQTKFKHAYCFLDLDFVPLFPFRLDTLTFLANWYPVFLEQFRQ